ncbi:MAG: hypothetical protein ACTH58_12765, partial [Marinomonas foliarum]|uniref:hypothetical protein n=1 Tax=Marinomonas foliarum TaxID=491950 RepID=UPI003F954D9C
RALSVIMENEEFNQKLYEYDIDRNIFTLGKPPRDCMYAIQVHGDSYEVYYFERGIKEYTKTFSDKGASLNYLLELLLADPRAKGNFSA